MEESLLMIMWIFSVQLNTLNPPIQFYKEVYFCVWADINKISVSQMKKAQFPIFHL